MTKVLALALLIFAATANAATVTVFGTDVKFTYDDASLYGTGTVINNTIFFNLSTLKAESLNGEGLVQASEALDITIEVTSITKAMNGFQLLENGDYQINGAGASVSAIGSLLVDSQTSAFSDTEAFNAGALTTSGALTAWSAGAAMDFGDTAGWDTDTKVIMTLENTLSAETLNSGVGETAFIEKKFEATAVGITSMMVPVPVPAAVWLFGSALGLLGWMRRKVT